MEKILLSLSLVIMLSTALSPEERTVVAVSNPWPPFIESDNTGFALDIVRESFRSQGYSLDMVIVPWARAETGVISSEYDILPDVWFSLPREKSLLFSRPFYENTVKFIKRKGDPFVYEGIYSLKGKTVGVIDGYGYDEAFLNSTLFERVAVPDIMTNIRKLLANRIDLTLADELVGINLMTRADPALMDRIEFVEKPLSVKPLHIASGRNNVRSREIIEAFNRGLEEIRSNGTFQAILNKYGLE